MGTYDATLLRGSSSFGTGKFSQGLTGGVYALPSNPTSAVGTLDLWVKTSAVGQIRVMAGNNGTAANGTWIGVENGGTPTLGLPGGFFSGGSAINDGNWHHIALTVDGTNAVLWSDGVAVVTRPTSMTFNLGAGTTAIGGFGGETGFDWVGVIDEVRFSNSVRYTSTFTPSASPYSSDGATVALFHLDNNATDTAGIVSATAPGQVTGLSVTPGNAQAALSWSAPSDGGSAITDYTVEYRVTSVGGAWTAFAHTAGTATSRTVTGLTNGTGYDFRVSAVNSVGTGTASSTATGTPTSGGGGGGGSIAPNDSNLSYSPGNWDVTSARAKTINPGAYLRFSLAATACTLTFDVSANATPFPLVKYRVDQGPWTVVTLAASIALTIPSNGWGTHSVEFVVQSTSEFVNRWNPQAAAVTLTGITTAGTTVPVTRRSLSGIVLGDSITEGYRNLSSSTDPSGSDAEVVWAYRLGSDLGAEIGVVGFGGQGWQGSGQGGVPRLVDAYKLLWGGGPARSFTGLDFVLVNMGENDGGSVASSVTTFLNDALSVIACPILMMRPFSGNQAVAIQQGIAACSNPSRVTYVDTAGWWSSADSGDGQHPWGYASINRLAPLTAAAVRSALGPGTAITPGATYLKLDNGTLKQVALAS